MRVIFLAEKRPELTCRYFEIDQLHNVDNFIIPQVERHAQLLQDIVVRHFLVNFGVKVSLPTDNRQVSERILSGRIVDQLFIGGHPLSECPSQDHKADQRQNAAGKERRAIPDVVRFRHR